jgi:hypothetical protein
LTAVAIVVTWVAAIILTRRSSVSTSIIVSTGAAVLIAWGSIAISVPMNEASFYMGPGLPISSECGRGGVPTWWPRWVPL